MVLCCSFGAREKTYNGRRVSGGLVKAQWIVCYLAVVGYPQAMPLDMDLLDLRTQRTYIPIVV